MEIKKINSNQIKLGAIISYFAIVFNIVAGLIYTPWMVRQIGQSDYGLYSLALTVVSYFTIDFGLSSAISRFISKYRAEGDENKVSNLLGIIYKLYLIIDILVFIILIVIWLFLNNIFMSLTSNEIIKFKVIFCIIGLFTLISFPSETFNGILNSYEKFTTLKCLDLLNKILIIIFMIIALFMGYGLYALVIVNVSVGILIIGLKVFYIKKVLNIKVNFKYRSKPLLKEIFSFSIWMTVISIAQRLAVNISPTILGIFSGSIAISVFAIGTTIEGYTWNFANALNGLFLPKVSRMVANSNDRTAITDLMVKVGRIQLLIIGMLIVGVISMGQEFIILWMGKGFKDSYLVVILLIIPGIITLTQEIANTLLIVVNEVKFRAILFILMAIVSLTISLILSPKLGAIGCGIGIFCGNIIGNVIGLNFVYLKVLKLDIFRFFKECHVKMCIPMLISLGVGFMLSYYFPAVRWTIFFCKVFVLSSTYLLCMWIISMNRYEKGLIKGIFKKIKR